jgi:chorismate mutase
MADITRDVYREAIDLIDDDIIEAINSRRELAQAIIAQRVQEGHPRVDPDRVAEISARYAAGVKVPDAARRARNFADAVLSVCA